ncbi:MAG TPA: ABC transporter permease [Blastocatellia bacterium]|nr:ABC transporter permease [Blastocatellia bacterium]
MTRASIKPYNSIEMETTPAPTIKLPNRRSAEDRQGHAGFADYAGVALDSLRANKLRSFLTLLGIIIGITSIISVISIIQGLDHYWKAKVSNFGPNTFVVTQFPITTNIDKLFEMIRRNPDIRTDVADAIRQGCTACEAVGVETHKEARAKHGRQSVEGVDMAGMTPNILDIEPFEVEVGRTIQDWEEEHSRFVTFVGWEIADRLFPGADPLGQTIQIDDHQYTIVGVAEKKGTVLGFSRDNFAKVPLSTFHKIYGSRRSVNISVKAREGQMQQAEDQARVITRAQHHLDYHDEDDFGMITSEGVNELFDKLTQTIFAVSIFVVGISLVVGGIVIMNIMLVSVVERTKEIGIRKAVGARQQDVVNQFLVESVVLCCTGGLGGIVFAWLISWTLARFTPLPSSFPLWAPLVAITLSTIIGVFFGIYPARRAGKLDPIEALRAD